MTSRAAPATVPPVRPERVLAVIRAIERVRAQRETASAIADSTSSVGSSSTPPETMLTVDDLWPALSEEQLAQHELVRQRYVKEFSSGRLYQAAAAKDPDYWQRFTVGQVRLQPDANSGKCSPEEIEALRLEAKVCDARVD